MAFTPNTKIHHKKMTIEIILNGTMRTVTKNELFDLASNGAIGPETPINVNGKNSIVGKVKGIVFAPPPVKSSSDNLDDLAMQALQESDQLSASVLPSAVSTPELPPTRMSREEQYQWLENSILQDILEGRPVNFQKALHNDLKQCITPAELGSIYLKILQETIEHHIPEQLGRVLSGDEELDAIINGKSAEVKAAIKVKNKRLKEVLPKSRDMARKRLRNITGMLSDGGQFSFGGGSNPFFLVYREETVKGQRAYSLTDIETGNLMLFDTMANPLGTERGYLNR